MTADVLIRKGFIDVGGGQVHYRSAGSGPPVIFLHDSPRSSVLHVPQLKEFSDKFTCIAIDTPGYGNSTPLDLGRQLEIPDFGTALADTIGGFGVERCPVYGFHTSSKITLAFAAKHPERVAVAILDGLSLPPGGAEPKFIESYMKPFVPDHMGGYLGFEWTRALDFQRWFPWFAKTKATRLPGPARTLSHLHEYAMDLFMAGPNFSDAYAAAMRYVALPVISTLKARTIFMARQDDVLHAFLASLPDPLPQGCDKESLPPDRENWKKRLREIFTEHADFEGAANFVPPDPLKTAGAAGQITNGYVDHAYGQMLVRRAGGGGRRAVVFLPDMPGSARQDIDFLSALAKDRAVFGLDLPGMCDSTPLPAPSPENYAAAIAQTLDGLGLGQVDLIAEGMSTPLAAAFAKIHPSRVATLVLDGAVNAPADLRTEMRINYCPDLRPTREGLHLHKAFHMLRDQEAQWPWYDGAAGSIRKIEPRIEADRLYVRLVDTLKQYDHYADPIMAALDVDMASTLTALSVKAVVCAAPDDPRYAMAEATAKAVKGSRVIDRPGEVSARAAALLAALE
ncbi:MAG: alpha/beta fold hydrolase [Rhodobacteraceae bacterium]|nr:alpha/beta fold hydrolase [Paracoccaceae bacterium]